MEWHLIVVLIFISVRISNAEYSFNVLVSHLWVLFGKMSIQVFCLSFKLAFFFILNSIHACSVMFDSCNPWTVNHQPPLYIEFSRQEYWSGLSSSTPQDLRESEIEPVSLAFSACAATWKVHRQTLLLIAIIILSSSPLLYPNHTLLSSLNHTTHLWLRSGFCTFPDAFLNPAWQNPTDLSSQLLEHLNLRSPSVPLPCLVFFTSPYTWHSMLLFLFSCLLPVSQPPHVPLKNGSSIRSRALLAPVTMSPVPRRGADAGLLRWSSG